MKIFLSKNTSPYVNLCIEEMLVNDKDLTGNVLFIYQHDNAIIIGRNQNAYEEINRDYIEKNKIDVARRLSGGGAVYQDLGNINFSFIAENKNGGEYIYFLKPIIEFLKSLGLEASFHGRNDLLCNGAKISGNAQYIRGNRIVSHGTLLFDVDLTKLGKALNPSKIKMDSKGIQSARQRVTNIAKELNYSITVIEFIEKLIQYFIKNNNASLEDIAYTKYENQLDKLIDYKKTEEWIYSKQANFDAENTEKFDGGIIKVKYSVDNNIIKDIAFEGDFLSKKELDPIIEKIIGTTYKKENVLKVLDSFELSNYFGTITNNEILKLIFG